MAVVNTPDAVETSAQVNSQVLDDKLDLGISKSVASTSNDGNTSDEEADRKAFLATFSAEEDKAIRKKVDRRFLWLIGLIYIIKNVRSTHAASPCMSYTVIRTMLTARSFNRSTTKTPQL